MGRIGVLRDRRGGEREVLGVDESLDLGDVRACREDVGD
jgi:hypothetical protein